MLRHYKALSLLAAVAVASASFAVAAMPAYAQSKPVVVTGERDVSVRVVSYRDLNLAAMKDRNILYRRVGLAVGEACDDVDVTLDDFGHGAACRTASWDDARPKIARAIARARLFATNGAVPLAATAAITISTPAG